MGKKKKINIQKKAEKSAEQSSSVPQQPSCAQPSGKVQN